MARHLRTFHFIEEVARVGSIRRAADGMGVTASALNKRIQSFEEEFGAAIFERLPRGVRLNAAGELLMVHIRHQRHDFARLQSQVADLAGVRRGHVRIAASQGLLPYFLPSQIARYRDRHPGVTFSVLARDRAEAEIELANLNCDLALVFEPIHFADFHVICEIDQPVAAVFARDHPLAAMETVRLRDCLDYDIVLPGARFGSRTLIEAAIRRTSRTARVVIEAESVDFMRHYIVQEQAVTFQIPIGLSETHMQGMTFRAIEPADLEVGRLLLGQMKGRVLATPISRFADQLVQALHQHRQDSPVAPRLARRA